MSAHVRLPRSHPRQPPSTALAPRTGGVAGNARLTGAVAVALLVLLAAEGVTIPFIGQLLGPHMFIGLLLIPPVALKLASTGYRFARYYTHDEPYVRKGPPPIRPAPARARRRPHHARRLRHRRRPALHRAAEQHADLRPQAELHRLGGADGPARARPPARAAAPGERRLAAQRAAARRASPGPGCGRARSPRRSSLGVALGFLALSAGQAVALSELPAPLQRHFGKRRQPEIMDPIQKRELKRQAWMRLAAQRRRAGLLRGRVVAISLVCFAAPLGHRLRADGDRQRPGAERQGKGGGDAHAPRRQRRSRNHGPARTRTGAYRRRRRGRKKVPPKPNRNRNRRSKPNRKPKKRRRRSKKRNPNRWKKPNRNSKKSNPNRW